mmetsp:Transcript_128625/g.333473  ORF Transcript_128625/g.333473 Transcript_128625/m.333473 type:complete len:284 (+) Transcript_128625:77-928(+)
MAPVASSADSKLVLPATLIGRLIGRGGATIRELERLTDCRIRIPRRAESSCTNEQVGHEQGEGALVSISVRSVAARAPTDVEISEGRCLRAAQLLCVESLDLEAALAQADAERQAQEDAEVVAWKENQESMAVRRIKLNCPEFDDADVRAALREACDDEDEAADLLLQGYRAPLAAAHPVPRPQSPKPESQPAEREDFPSLLTNPAAPARSSRGLALNGKGSWTRAATHRQQQVSPSCSEAFPGLPEPSPKPAARTSAACRARVLRQSCQQQRRAPQMTRRRW